MTLLNQAHSHIGAHATKPNHTQTHQVHPASVKNNPWYHHWRGPRIGSNQPHQPEVRYQKTH
jgi:hypothetical protein